MERRRCILYCSFFLIILTFSTYVTLSITSTNQHTNNTSNNKNHESDILLSSTPPTIRENKHPFHQWNLTKCCDKMTIYIYQMNLRNITENIPSNVSAKNWKFGVHCYFTKYSSLNQLYLPILNWYQELSTEKQDYYSFTQSPNDACISIFPAIPNACNYDPQIYHQLESMNPQRDFAISRKYVSQWFRQIPSWRENNDGSNHLIIDFYDNDNRGPWDSSGRVYNSSTKQLEWFQIYPHATIDAGNAMIIGSNLDRRYYRPHFDISIPLIHIPLQDDDNRSHDPNHLSLYENSGSPGYSPFVSPRVRRHDVIISNEFTNKRHLICFLGTIYSTTCCKIRNIFQIISQKISNTSILYIPDIYSTQQTPYNHTVYYHILSQCVYGLVLSGKGYHSYRLVELLSLGVIPLIVRNPYYVLPFENHWKWDQLSVVYEESDFTETNWTIITKMAKERDENYPFYQQKIIQLQHEGMKFYQKYLDDKRSLWRTIIHEATQRIENEMMKRRKEICGEG